MSDIGQWIEDTLQRINDRAIERPRTVVALFLVATIVFAAGIPLITTASDPNDSFSEGIEAQEAFDAVEAQFEDPFTPDEETTQVIHSGNNVLSREAMLQNLALLERIDGRDDLRMESANGPATLVAQSLDPSADTPTEQRRVIQQATDSEIRRAVREAGTDPRFSQVVSDDFNQNQPTASTSITVISHDVPKEFTDDDVQNIQVSIDELADEEPADMRAFGQGVFSDELGSIVGDSVAIVMPVVLFLLLAFLVVAYRDPIDLGLGLAALLMTAIWTFGFLGYAGIPFGQQVIAVPVLLLAVGVDFGIHIINRYREETVQGVDPVPAMQIANNQLAIAFFIVTATAVFGFGANIVSDLRPIQELGISSSVGIVATYLIFGFFLPSAKLETDRFRERFGVPEFDSTPIASEESALGRLLAVSATVGERAPVLFVLVLVLLGAGMGAYGTGVDTTFEQEDFLPPEEEAWYVQYIPEPFAPQDYTVTETVNLLEDRFAASQDQTLIIYVEGPFEEAHALEALASPDDNPPDSLAVTDGGEVETQSIITVIQSQAERDPEFAALVARNDRNGNGIPDQNLGRIYDELDASQAGSRADQYLTEDRRAAQIEYTIDAEATQGEIAADGVQHAEEFRYSATATGEIVVFAAVSDIIFQSAIQGMMLAVGLSAIFLVFMYGVLEGKPGLGIVNVFPIVVAVAGLIGTMRFLGLPLNALTATILSIGIGLGVAYSVHVTARFIDEYNEDPDPLEALKTTLSGTGGALTGSMLTTSIGTGALALAITPVLGNFGLLIALSVFYSFVASVIALPPALFLWDRAAQTEATGLGQLKAVVWP